MEKRRLGKIDFMSSVIAMGGAAFWQVKQKEAEAAIELAIEHGVNYIDVAPSYGQAELRFGPWLEHHRKDIFLACKTALRSKAKAWEQLKRSLELLKVDHFDLYQFHMVSDIETLNAVLGLQGAIEAVQEAKQQGLLRYIGITGHRPLVQIEALNRFPFDTVMFPLNRVLAAHTDDYNDFTALLTIAQQKNLGILAIKAVTRRPWEGTMHMYKTWYEPFDDQAEIDKSLWYTLSQGVTSAPMPGDVTLWPMVIDAAERFKVMDANEQQKVVSEVKHYNPLFSMGWAH